MKYINKIKTFELVKKGAMLVDMRSPIDFRDGKIDGSVNLPLKNFLNTLTGLERKKKIVIFAKTIDDSDIKSACNYADQLGFENIFVTEYKQLSK